MNVTTVSTGTGTTTQHTTTTTLNSKTYKIEMIDDGQSMCSDDEDDDIISTDGSMYGDGDLAQMAVQDDVANQLAAAGPVGVAAAAAIASSKKRKRAHSFETNPSVRKRQQNRLLRKLRGIIYEFTGRVGKQAVVLVATPGKPNTSYKVFGAKPLEDVVRNLKNIVMEELESALAQQAPPPPQEDPSLFELPPLIIDGIPTPVEKMTQAQLRAFIPLMLKYSTGRGKPGWGRESTRPPWWPKELPWANVRMDARSEDDKQKISWTHALRKIVINCYKYHGREDLLPTFADDDDKINQLISQTGEDDDDEEPMTTTITQQVTNAATNTTHNQVNVVKINSAGTVITTHNPNLHNPNNPQPTIIQSTNNQHVTTTATLPASTKIEICTAPQQSQQHHQSQQTRTNEMTVISTANAQNIANTQYTQTVLSQNADGTVSLIQVDPNNPIITLPDGTTAQVQGVATLHQGEGGATIQAVQSLGDVNGHENMTVDLTEVGQDGQIYITAEDGQGYPVTSMITVPVTSAMYNSMIANIQQIHTNSDGTVCITPMQVDSHNNNNNHIQCYSIMAATAPGSGSRLLAASSPTMPPSANQNQTNVPNNNNNNNSSSSSSSSRSNISCNNQTRCQIFNQSSLSNNSSQPLHQRQQQNQQQLQQNQSQMQPATTRVIIAGNLHANPLNFNVNTNTNLGTNINNNNNNNIIINNNNHNNKIGGIASAVPLPIVLTTGSPAALVANASITKRTSTHKRRKQNFSKTVPIKLENRATSESLLNIHIVDSHDHANVDGGSRNQGRVGGSSDIVSTVDAAGGGGSDISLPTKTIKLENVKK